MGFFSNKQEASQVTKPKAVPNAHLSKDFLVI
jgi:hypothetical protein